MAGQRFVRYLARGILVVLLAWVTFAAFTSWTWCRPGDFGSCMDKTLLASGVVGGGPMLLVVLIAGLVAAVVVFRR